MEMNEKKIGVVTHFFGGPSAAVLNLSAPLKVGDEIHVVGSSTDLVEEVRSMQIEHNSVGEAYPGDDVAILVSDVVRAGDEVYLRVEQAVGYAPSAEADDMGMDADEGASEAAWTPTPQPVVPAAATPAAVMVPASSAAAIPAKPKAKAKAKPKAAKKAAAKAKPKAKAKAKPKAKSKGKAVVKKVAKAKTKATKKVAKKVTKKAVKKVAKKTVAKKIAKKTVAKKTMTKKKVAKKAPAKKSAAKKKAVTKKSRR